MKSRKATIRDVGFIIIVFFTFMVTLLFAKVIWTEINEEGFQKLDIVDTPTKDNINNIGYALTFLDKMAPFLFLALWLLTLFTSITVKPDHPIFFILNIGVLVFFTLISILLVDFGNQILENTVFADVLPEVGNTQFFIQNYHYISFVIMLISVVIFFRKTKMAEGAGIQ